MCIQLSLPDRFLHLIQFALFQSEYTIILNNHCFFAMDGGHDMRSWHCYLSICQYLCNLAKVIVRQYLYHQEVYLCFSVTAWALCSLTHSITCSHRHPYGVTPPDKLICSHLRPLNLRGAAFTAPWEEQVSLFIMWHRLMIFFFFLSPSSSFSCTDALNLSMWMAGHIFPPHKAHLKDQPLQ